LNQKFSGLKKKQGQTLLEPSQRQPQFQAAHQATLQQPQDRRLLRLTFQTRAWGKSHAPIGTRLRREWQSTPKPTWNRTGPTPKPSLWHHHPTPIRPQSQQPLRNQESEKVPRNLFSRFPHAGARNYLVVFYLAVPQAEGTDSLTKVSAPGQATPGSGNGSFTTSYGFTWHYTYERTVTTTITSVSAEKAPHNHPSTLLCATAYSEQGIPVSEHSPHDCREAGQGNILQARQKPRCGAP